LGISSGLLLVWGNYIANIASCMFFFLSYLLDNCDGEVARARDQTSIFGYYLDSFVDWIVHAVFFLCLGFGEYTRSDEILWLGFGVAASLGATINYGIRVYLDFINGRNKHLPVETNINQQKDLQSASWNEKIAFIFRELARADFW